MKLSDICKAIPSMTALRGGEVEILGVTHDSRDVRRGDLFVALPGRQHEGLAFWPSAWARGAVALAVAPGVEAPEEVNAVATLREPRREMGQIAALLSGHPARRMRMIGVTGTNGKSTTTALIAEMVAAARLSPGLIGTLEHRLGDQRRATIFTTPEAPALQRLLAEMVALGVDTCAMEVSSIGLVEHRVEAIEFQATGFLNLTQDHLDYHPDMRAYGEAKASLFSAQRGGVAVINVEDPFGATLADQIEGPEVWRLSLDDPTAEVHFEGLHLDAHGCRGRLHTPRGALTLKSPLIGRFNAVNVALAAALAVAVGVPIEGIERGVVAARVRGRLESVDNTLGASVVVDYAHSPDALERVLEALRPITPGRLFCLFGCGGDRDPIKRAPMGRVAVEGADAVIITSDNPRTEDPAAIASAATAGALAAGAEMVGAPQLGGVFVELDRRAAIAAGVAALKPGDALLIAGKGHEEYQEIHGVRRPFNDVEVAAEALWGRR